MHRFVTDLLVTTTASAVMLAAVLLAGTALVQPVPPPAAWTDDDAGTCHDVPVAALAASAVEGWGRLCLDHGVVRLVLQVGGLTPGDAYTAWLAYFDRPDGCAQTPCGLVDLRGDDPAGVLGRVGGGVPNHTRMLELRAELRDLLIAPGAQVSLLLLNHGPASIVDARARARQVLTPEMPDFGGPGLGAAGDGRKAFPHALAVFTVR